MNTNLTLTEVYSYNFSNGSWNHITHLHTISVLFVLIYIATDNYITRLVGNLMSIIIN